VSTPRAAAEIPLDTAKTFNPRGTPGFYTSAITSR
jgi:hypothetical protein